MGKTNVVNPISFLLLYFVVKDGRNIVSDHRFLTLGKQETGKTC